MFVKRFLSHRFFFLSLMAFLLVGISVLALRVPDASAHTASGGSNLVRHPHVHTYLLYIAVSCSGKGCNHLDPYRTGCAASGYTVATAALDIHLGKSGWVHLMYSSTCQTNWDEVVSGNGVEYLSGCVARAAGPDGPQDAACSTSTAHSWINTDMVWSPHNRANAGGCFVEICRGGPSGPISGYYTQTGYY